VHKHPPFKLAETAAIPPIRSGDVRHPEPRHDHGPVADHANHDHAIGIGVEVDGKPITPVRRPRARTGVAQPLPHGRLGDAERTSDGHNGIVTP
jgi:hypothetical protein